MSARNYRFREYDYWFAKVQRESQNLTIKQIEQILNGMKTHWNDLTFKFFEDGKVTIFCNNSDTELKPADLTGASYDFYVRKRIEQIKSKLMKSA